MSRTRLAALVSAVLFLRWLVTGHVAVTVGGITVTVPALVVTAAAVVTVAAAAVAMVVYRVRAERAMLAAWQARRVAAL